MADDSELDETVELCPDCGESVDECECICPDCEELLADCECEDDGDGEVYDEDGELIVFDDEEEESDDDIT